MIIDSNCLVLVICFTPEMLMAHFYEALFQQSIFVVIGFSHARIEIT